MGDEYIRDQLIEILCKELQTLWLISLKDMTLKIFAEDSRKIIPDSVSTAEKINSYDEARIWYIENCVAENSKEKLIEQTQIDYILERLSERSPFFIEYGRKRKGKINYNQLYYDKIVNPQSGKAEYLVMAFRNIDVSKKAELDELTGVYSRTVFFAKAEEMLRNNPDVRYDLVISDIVDFKKINETYGTKVADDILRWEGDFLNRFSGDQMLIGRYGGDQMVLFGSRECIMNCMSEECRKNFWNAEEANGLPTIIVKFGVYLDVNHDKSIVASCDKAHMALNSIKHHYSKEIAYYNEELRDYLDRQRRIEESMHQSLRNRDFKVYYQPKHDAKTGEMVGAEALIRWIHPEYGFMSPADFIPLFEQNGFIEEIDHFVWNRTCENIKKWEQRGVKTVPISVNASKLTMNNDDLVSMLEYSLNKYDVSSSKMHIEVTETLMTENADALVEKLNKIRALGIEVELDDFGSGYSSLNVLSTFPIDVLKLDMSFLQQFGDKKREKVLTACINLAKELGFITVSEGVELEEQRTLLGKLGVDMIQGYYYSKPLPEDEFEVYMMRH